MPGSSSIRTWSARFQPVQFVPELSGFFLYRQSSDFHNWVASLRKISLSRVVIATAPLPAIPFAYSMFQWPDKAATLFFGNADGVLGRQVIIFWRNSSTGPFPSSPSSLAAQRSGQDQWLHLRAKGDVHPARLHRQILAVIDVEDKEFANIQPLQILHRNSA